LHQITAVERATTTDGGIIRLENLDAYVTYTVTVCNPVPTTTATTQPRTTTVATTAPTTAATTSTTVAGTTTTTPTTQPPSNQALTATPAVGSPGLVTMVHGSGFAPGAKVTLEWLPGIGTVIAVAGPDGTFNVGLLVLSHDQVGQRQVHAQGFPGNVATAFLVETGTAVPPSHGGAALVFRH
jgi:hypothetical protein